jgi:SPP1 gp7 family putative phage head morphogenesis protein
MPRDPLKSFIVAERLKRLKQERITARTIELLNEDRPPTPKALSTRYSAFLTRAQKEVNRQIREILKPLIKTILALRQDGLDELVTETFKTALKTEGVIDNFLNPDRLVVGVNKQGNDIAVWNTKKYDRHKVYRVIGLNNLPAGTELGIVNGWTVENLELIKNVNIEQLQKIKALMYRSLRDGSRASSITQAIASIMKSSVNRASLIAVDQTLKLNGQLDRVKNENAGIKKYIWRTSKDEAVRSKHRAREGKSYFWNKGPPGGQNPGQEIRCRCTAEPDLDHLLGKNWEKAA